MLSYTLILIVVIARVDNSLDNSLFLSEMKSPLSMEGPSAQEKRAATRFLPPKEA